MHIVQWGGADADAGAGGATPPDTAAASVARGTATSGARPLAARETLQYRSSDGTFHVALPDRSCDAVADRRDAVTDQVASADADDESERRVRESVADRAAVREADAAPVRVAARVAVPVALVRDSVRSIVGDDVALWSAERERRDSDAVAVGDANDTDMVRCGDFERVFVVVFGSEMVRVTVESGVGDAVCDGLAPVAVRSPVTDLDADLSTVADGADLVALSVRRAVSLRVRVAVASAVGVMLRVD